MKLNNYIFHIVCLVLFFFGIVHFTNAEAKEADLGYNQQIMQLLNKGDCSGAANIAIKAEAMDKNLSYLPEWYYQIIQCYKSRHPGDGQNLESSIVGFFDRQFDQFMSKKLCNESEKYLQNIDPRVQ